MRTYTSDPRGIKPLVRGEIIPAQGASIPFADNDVDGNSVSIITATSNPGEFTVGAAVMGQLTFTLLNGSGAFSNIDWYDSKVAFHLLVGNDDFEMGTFYVVDHKETGYCVTVTCYDALKVMDEYQLYEDKQDATTPLTFPTTVANAVSIIAGHRGLTVTGLPAIASNIQIDDPNDDYMSERSFISYCAQCCGVFVTAYRQQLRFGWYDTSGTPYDMGVTFSHDLRTNDITITGVKVVTADGNRTETRGTTGYQLEIEDNPLITADNIVAITGYIYSAVNGITYRPGTVDIVGTPALEAGDRIEIETAQESGIILLATTINYGTDLTISITADCEPYAGDLRINRSRYIKKMAKQAVAEELADANSDLAQAIDQAAGGGTVVHFPKVTIYDHDQSSLYGDLPFTRDMAYAIINTTYYGQRVTGGHYQIVTWAKCDAVIPPYDANNNQYFDISLPLDCVTCDVGSFYAGSLDPTGYYPMILHGRAHYATQDMLTFDTLWLDLRVASGYPFYIPLVQVPLPGRVFNITSQTWGAGTPAQGSEEDLHLYPRDRYVEYITT